MFCYDEFSLAIYNSLYFGLFSVEAPGLIYYPHLTAIVISLTLGLFVFINSRLLPARILFLLAIVFSTLSVLDILLWTQIDSRIVMALWSFWPFLFISVYILSLYFLRTFIEQKDVSLSSKFAGAFVAIATLLISASSYSLDAFDLYNCNAVENFLVWNFIYGLSFFIFLATCYYAIRGIFATKDPFHKKRSLYVSLGVGCFLIVFSAAAYIASIANLLGGDPEVFTLEQYGYFGMALFIALLTYTIVQYRAFNLKLIASQALVVTLWVLVGSLLFVVKSDTSRIIASATLIFTTFAGYLLVRSVKREVEQRERIEKLARDLEKANARLKELDKQKSEFVSIASHQLRSPLTAIRGYASMLAGGSFGKLPEKAQESAERIEESAKIMAMSVEDYLNVSRIESGNMKYNLSDFNLRDEVSHICDDLRPEALKHNLILLFRTDLTSRGIVHADIGKTNQIVHNLINNALKYTPKGSISVFMRDDLKKKRIYVEISDTGIGMSKETTEKLFNKFTRASNANSVNVSGTGLGLFVALKMAEAMGGTITAASEGDGKGSTFTLEMPLAM